MDTYKKNIKDSAEKLLDESKKKAGHVYDDGVKKMHIAQKEAQEYTDELLETVRENPFKSVLIAGGIGFLISLLLKK